MPEIPSAAFLKGTLPFRASCLPPKTSKFEDRLSITSNHVVFNRAANYACIRIHTYISININQDDIYKMSSHENSRYSSTRHGRRTDKRGGRRENKSPNCVYARMQKTFQCNLVGIINATATTTSWRNWARTLRYLEAASHFHQHLLRNY